MKALIHDSGIDISCKAPYIQVLNSKVNNNLKCAKLEVQVCAEVEACVKSPQVEEHKIEAQISSDINIEIDSCNSRVIVEPVLNKRQRNELKKKLAAQDIDMVCNTKINSFLGFEREIQ